MKLVLMIFLYFGLNQAITSQRDLNSGFRLNQILNFSPRATGLLGDFLDLVSLIDTDQIEEVINSHLESDGAFVAVIQYAQSDKWTNLADQILNIQGVQELIVYLELKDIPVTQLFESISKLIDEATPGVDPDENGSLRSLLDEIEAAVPFNDLVILINNKLQSSPEFQRLYVLVSGERYFDVVTAIRRLEEIQRLEQRLKDFGVEVDEILKLVYSFFGWGNP